MNKNGGAYDVNKRRKKGTLLEEDKGDRSRSYLNHTLL